MPALHVLLVLPLAVWGQEAPFYDTVQWEHPPELSNRIGGEFCENALTSSVVKENLRNALRGLRPFPGGGGGEGGGGGGGGGEDAGG
jgi:hypothetical protein